MKKILTILFCLCVLSSLAQKRYKGATQSNVEGHAEKSLFADSAIGLPRYSSKLDTSFIKYQGRQNDALLFADTLNSVIYWYNPHTGTVEPVNKAGVGNATGYAIIDTVQATGMDTIIAVYTGTATVSGVQTMTLNGSGIQYFRQPPGSNYTYIYYGDAPEGQIIYNLPLVGAVNNSTDSTGGGIIDTTGTGGGTDTTGGGTDTTGGGVDTSGVGMYTLTLDTSCQVKFGALFGLGSTSTNMIALANAGLPYARVPYNGSGTPLYPGFSGYNVLLSYNPSPPSSGNYTALPTDSLAFRNTLKTTLTANGTTNLIGVALINEYNNIRHGAGYWNPISAKNVINLFIAGAHALHELGLKAYEGGATGEILYYKVWEDFITRGRPDSAAAFAAKVFPAGTNLNNWRSDTSHGYRIRYLDTIFAALPSLPLDGVNFHYYEVSLDKDSLSATIDPNIFKSIAKYMHRVSGKPVFTNEFGVNNNTNPNIMSELIDAVEELHDAKNGDMSMAFWYAGNANYALANPDGSLTDFGKAFKQKIRDTHADITP